MSPETVPAKAAAAPQAVDARLVGWMLGLTFLWGFNAITIKMVTLAMAPLMSAGLRGVVALAAVTLYGWLRGESMRYRGLDMAHGLVIGSLFGLEFMFIYVGVGYTNGGHLSLFVNTAPIFVACGAHFLLAGERLHLVKSAGLLLAFGGVALLFSDELYIQKRGFWRGDLLVLAGAVSWAVTTLYMKRYVVERFNGFRLLHSQLLVSTPLLLGASLLLETTPLAGATAGSMVLVVFQGLIVVFFSYLMWMNLLIRYPASGMQSFTFLAPVWGVLAGVVLLGETVSLLMAAGMALIGLGLYLVNRPRSLAA
jgi:drug/metabolite transporter (DMT)-like permease